MLGKLFESWANKTQLKEIQTFIDGLRAVDSEELGLVVAQAAHWRSKIEAEGIPISDPIAVHGADPTVVLSLIRIVQQMQRQNRQHEAPGLMVWVHSLRAGNSFELRNKAREMWSQLARGFPHAVEAAGMHGMLFDEHLNIENYDEFSRGSLSLSEVKSC
jgi:hypothetical protein